MFQEPIAIGDLYVSMNSYMYRFISALTIILFFVNLIYFNFVYRTNINVSLSVKLSESVLHIELSRLHKATANLVINKLKRKWKQSIKIISVRRRTEYDQQTFNSLLSLSREWNRATSDELCVTGSKLSGSKQFFGKSQFNNNCRAAAFMLIIIMYSTVELCVTVYYIIMVNTIYFN